MSKIKVGDKVAWSAKFLRSIADFSKYSADKRGVVEKIEDLGGGMVIATVPSISPMGIRIENLAKGGSAAFGDNSI